MGKKHERTYEFARTMTEPGVLTFSHANLADLVNLVKLSNTAEQVRENGHIFVVAETLRKMKREATQQLIGHVQDEVRRWAKNEWGFSFDQALLKALNMDFNQVEHRVAVWSRDGQLYWEHGRGYENAKPKPAHHRVCGKRVHDHRGVLRRKR